MTKKVHVESGENEVAITRRDVLEVAIDTLQNEFEAGDVVETPDGLGFVDDRITEGTVDGEEATEDEPIYAVGMVEEADVNFYREEQLESGELPDTDVDDPVEDIAEEGTDTQAHMFADSLAYSEKYQTDVLQFGDFDYPDSWEESEVPARLILMDAWTSMGGQFDCGGGACCKGTMRQSGMSERASDQFCASMKDRVLQWEGWRQGG